MYSQLKRCLSLTTLDCQEGYFFDQEEITKIVRNDSQLTGLIIPYAFIDVIGSLRNLTHICVRDKSYPGVCRQNEKQEALLRHVVVKVGKSGNADKIVHLEFRKNKELIPQCNEKLMPS